MNVLFDDDGLKIASIFSEQTGSLQVEDVRGKRSKLKTTQILLRFEGELIGFLESAQQEASAIDVPLLWECCGGNEFNFSDASAEYFGAKPSAVQQAAVLLAIQHSPIYFHKKGRGSYKAAAVENVQAALAGIEKRRLQTIQIELDAQSLLAGKLPASFSSQVLNLLYRPDKNSLEYKALDLACKQSAQSPLAIFRACDALPSARNYHQADFLFEHFPKGLVFPADAQLSSWDDLPCAAVEAFSIDDVSTTEIDDAFSLTHLADGCVEVGIHIAAPALGIAPNSVLDRIALTRLSTVYMPSDKITMLPDCVSAAFSLQAGQTCPALSLYVTLDADFNIISSRNALENVPIVANLRIENLELIFNAQTVCQSNTLDYPFKVALEKLWQWANQLEIVRGKANPNRAPQIDFNIQVDADEMVQIVPRERGAPIDKLVSELMIFANSTWGRQLTQAGLAAIYRSQSMGKVRMGTSPAPHIGLGVAHYTWSSSPLRRAVDLVNQRQLISLVTEQAPVYKPNQTELFSIVRDFELAYQAYRQFQDKMERFWCIRYLQQQQINQLTGVVTRLHTLRVQSLPLFLQGVAFAELPVGAIVQVAITECDEWSLEIGCRVLDFTAQVPNAASNEDEEVETEPETEAELVVQQEVVEEDKTINEAGDAPLLILDETTNA